MAETDADNELWIRSVNSDEGVRVRNISNMLANGVAILDVRLLERTDESWIVFIRLSDRTGEFRLNQTKSDEAKSWRDVALAIAAVRDDLEFWGAISLSTERRPAKRQR